MSDTDTIASTLPLQVAPPETLTSAASWADLLGSDALGPDEAAVPRVVAVTVRPGGAGSSGGDGPVLDDEELLRALGLDPRQLLDLHAPTGEAGEVTSQPILGPEPLTLLLVGLGDGSTTAYRRAGAALARACADRDLAATSAVRDADDAQIEAFVVGVVLGSFGFHWRSQGPLHRPLARLLLVGAEGREEPVRTGRALGRAGWRARMLATIPSHLKNPPWLADQAASYAAEAGLDIEVKDERALRAEGFGGLLAVGAASETPPRLVRLTYTPEGTPAGSPIGRRGRRRLPHVVLVGKGITFDSGGLSIKPLEGMIAMKRDMTGGAVVMATMAALAEVGCPIRVTGLVAAAENAVGASSYRPGDVVRHYGGRTSEVSNTDAEGRLVLADALAYAVAELEPDALVDVATLTGAMKVALGVRTGGLFSSDDGLAAALGSAGAEAGEPFWRMPLDRRYDDRIASKIADADNSASPGAIAAALFLRPFAGSVPWAHLDIASVGDSATERFEWTTGPTGFGARALLTWLRRAEPLEGVAP